MPSQIPLDPYHLCLFNQLLGLEGVYVGIPLLFGAWGDLLSDESTYADPTNHGNNSDLLAFTLTLFFVVRSKKAGFGVSILLRTIAEDATRYFFFIFTFQLILVIEMPLYMVRFVAPFLGLQGVICNVYRSRNRNFFRLPLCESSFPQQYTHSRRSHFFTSRNNQR